MPSMNRSIFQKLLFSYLAVIILVIGVLAAFLTHFFNNFYFEQEQQALLDMGEQVIGQVLDCQTGKITVEQLADTVRIAGSTSGSRIFVLEGENIHNLQDPNLDAKVSEESDLLPDVRKILKGETVIKKKHYSSQLNAFVVFVGMPVITGENVSGMVLLFTPVAKINTALNQVYRIIWGTALFAFLLGGLVIFLTSRHLSRPLTTMKEAAAAIAEGDYSKEIAATNCDELDQLTASFNYMRERIQQVEKMRQELLANVSHELRTPLTSIRGFIQAILEGVVPEGDQEKYLKIAREEVDRLTRLVQDLLDLARIKSGSIKLNKEPLDIGELAIKVATEFRLIAAAKSITVETDEGLVISGDRDRIRQVMINLLSNAVKYTEQNGHIQIRVRREGGQAVLKVRDNGAGIPEAELEHIFDKFHRVDKSRDAATGGTGLGLAIVKELVELHNGSAAAWSAPGKGTEITIELPLVESADQRN
jgi:signal transduction histidine kinase